jgi:hypothetical protein
MGRGQLFSFAKNTWRTSTFKMEVDIRGAETLEYALTKKLSLVKGCRIEGELYQPIIGSDLDDAIREFCTLVRFASIPVVLNGKVVSQNENDFKWEFINDDAFIKTTRSGELYLYNMGVLVRSFSAYEFGCGGIINTRKGLSVNFARNDILRYECEVWGRVSKKLKELNLLRITGKDALTKEERDFLGRQWCYGELVQNELVPMNQVKLFTDVIGRHWSLEDLESQSQITVADGVKGRLGTKIHREGKAFVLAEETLTRFRVSNLKELLELIQRHTNKYLLEMAEDLETIALGCTDTYESLDDSAIPAAELCVLVALRELQEKFIAWFRSGNKSSGVRKLTAGNSDFAEAWTDGAEYIVLTRRVLCKALEKGVSGCLEVLLTLTHEYCHDCADLETHDHDTVFLTKHHDLVQYKGGKLLKMAQDLDKGIQRLAKKNSVELASLALEKKVSNKAKAPVERIAHKAQLSLFC